MQATPTIGLELPEHISTTIPFRLGDVLAVAILNFIVY